MIRTGRIIPGLTGVLERMLLKVVVRRKAVLEKLRNHPPDLVTKKILQVGHLSMRLKVSRRLKNDGGPSNGTVYRADNQGNITSYAVYDSEGLIVKRVDVTGAAHANVPTPHVIEYGRNTLPDGAVRVQSPSTKSAPRPANLDEMP
ncbi:hypothetical protein BVY11_14475 [Pseudomonas amygdali pv. morsprunorum]|nr:hypothetical protein BVY12_23915 [Pseudomonas amygdali pv. morsprunorum]PPS29895.1 hypothetical protein BVY11_14475 [Pseudomonas amygdali pv. morsprunorum]